MTLRLRAVPALALTVTVLATSLSAAAAAPTPSTAGSAGAGGASAAPVRTVLAPKPLLPNARALKANQLILRRDSGGQRVLRFESGLANVGRGPLEVRPNRAKNCPSGQQHASQIIYRDTDGSGFFSRRRDTTLSRRSAGCMIFHPNHDHWHFEAAARYVLYKPKKSQPIVVVGRKMSFCLRDSERAPNRWPTADYPQFYGDCDERTPQGISIGWVDIYQNYLPGQAIRLPKGLRKGRYCLRTVVDPRNQLVETKDTDNTSIRGMRIAGMNVARRPARGC